MQRYILFCMATEKVSCHDHWSWTTFVQVGKRCFKFIWCFGNYMTYICQHVPVEFQTMEPWKSPPYRGTVPWVWLNAYAACKGSLFVDKRNLFFIKVKFLYFWAFKRKIQWLYLSFFFSYLTEGTIFLNK